MTEKEKNIILYLLNNYIIDKREQMRNAQKRAPENTKRQTIQKHYNYINALNDKINELLTMYDKIDQLKTI